MWQKIVFIILIFNCLSCTKDRFPVPEPIAEPGIEGDIYFWNFNSISQSGISEPIISIGSSTLMCEGSFDASDGTDLNALEGTPPGSSLRLRNPAGYFLIKISTAGYEKIKMSYAVMRTNSGAQENIISYSIDGIEYSSTGLQESIVNVGLEFSIKSFDFGSVNALNNQNEVYVKISFNIGNTNETGNNRIDNLLIKGTSL